MTQKFCCRRFLASMASRIGWRFDWYFWRISSISCSIMGSRDESLLWSSSTFQVFSWRWDKRTDISVSTAIIYTSTGTLLPICWSQVFHRRRWKSSAPDCCCQGDWYEPQDTGLLCWFYRYMSAVQWQQEHTKQPVKCFPCWVVFLTVHFACLKKKSCTEMEQKQSSLSFPFACN